MNDYVTRALDPAAAPRYGVPVRPDWVTTTFGSGLPPGPGIPMVIDDGFTRTINFAGALAAGTLGVFRGRFTKTAH